MREETKKGAESMTESELSVHSQIKPKGGRAAKSNQKSPRQISSATRGAKQKQEKIFDQTNLIQTQLNQDEDGDLTFETMEGKLEKAWQHLKLRKREAKNA